MYKLYNATVFNAVKKRQGKLRGVGFQLIKAHRFVQHTIDDT